MGDHLGTVGGLHIFMHDALRQASASRFIYDRDHNYKKDTKCLLSKLIGYFSELDIDNDRCLDELARLYHIDKQWNALHALLTNLPYLYWKFQKCKADDLLDEYKMTLSDCDITSSSYTEYESFIKKHFVALKRLPSRIYQEAMNLNKTSSIKNNAETWNDCSEFDWGEALFPYIRNEHTTIFAANYAIKSFDWSPSGNEIAVFLNDGNVYIVDVTTRKARKIGSFGLLDERFTNKIEWNPSNEGFIGLLVYGYSGSRVFFISPDGNKPREVYRDQTHNSMISVMTWSNNGDYLLVGHKRQYSLVGHKRQYSPLTMINMEGSIVDELNICGDIDIAAINYILSFDNRLIISTSSEEIHRVDIVNGKLHLINSISMHGRGPSIKGIAFAGEESIFVLCFDFEKSLLIDINTMQEINQDEWGGEIIKTSLYSLSSKRMDLNKLVTVGNEFKFAKHDQELVAYAHGTEISICTIELLQQLNSEEEKVQLRGDLNKVYVEHKTLGSIEVTKKLDWSPTLQYQIKVKNEEGEFVTDGKYKDLRTSIVELDNKFKIISDYTISKGGSSLFDNGKPLRVAWQKSSDLVAIIFQSKLVIWDVANQNEKWVISSRELQNIFVRDDGEFNCSLIKWTNSDKYLFITWHDGLLRFDIDSMKVERILYANKSKFISALDVQDSLVVLGYKNNIMVDIIVIQKDLPEKLNSIELDLIDFLDLNEFIEVTSVLVDSSAINVSLIADGLIFLVVTDTGELTVWDRLTLKCILRYNSARTDITTAYFNHENGIVSMMSQSDVVSLVKLHLGSF